MYWHERAGTPITRLKPAYFDHRYVITCVRLSSLCPKPSLPFGRVASELTSEWHTATLPCHPAAAPVVPPAAEAVAAATAAAAAAAVCSAELKAADDETALPELEASPLELLLLAFGVDDLGMKDEANGDPPFAGILVISTRSIDGEYDRPSSPDP